MRTASAAGCAEDRRRGLTILELLVSMGVISSLAAVLLPAFGSAREAARRVQCTSHLKQIGLALHNYHDVHGSLPAAWQWDRKQQSAYSWSVPLLPFIDQGPLLATLDRGACNSSPVNAAAREMSLSIFLCPSDVAPRSFELLEGKPGLPDVPFPTANYFGVYGTMEPDDIRPTPAGDGSFINTRPVRFNEFTRGLSCTFILGERPHSMLPGSWLGFDDRDEDAQCRVVGEAFGGPNCQQCDECEFGSRHGGVSEFLWGDGHVQSLSESIDQVVYRQTARRHDTSVVRAF
jgi:prepilin-type processing-associated H-X9-DG protein